MVSARAASVPRAIATVTLAVMLAWSGAVRAGESQRPLAPTVPPAELPAAGLDLSRPAGSAADHDPAYRKWWFWAAVGVVLAGTTAAVICAGRSPTPPSTSLGNQEFRP